MFRGGSQNRAGRINTWFCESPRDGHNQPEHESEAECKEKAQNYIDRAITTLRQAVQNGSKNAAHMKQAADRTIVNR